MFKRLVFGALMALSLISHAASAQTLISDPYPAGSIDAVSLTVNGGTPIACTFPAVTTPTAGVQPTCPLASIATPGTYTLVMTVSKAAGCTSTTNAGTCTSGGPAASAPFLYTLKSSATTVPVPRLIP